MIKCYLWIIALIMITSCSSPKEPTFIGIEHIKAGSLDLSGIKIRFDVQFHNPNKYGLAVKSAVSKVYIDSIFIGDFFQDKLVSVPRLGNFSIPLSGTVSYLAFSRLNLKNLDSRMVMLRADGSVEIGKAGFFVKRKFLIEKGVSLSDLKF